VTHRLHYAQLQTLLTHPALPWTQSQAQAQVSSSSSIGDHQPAFVHRRHQEQEQEQERYRGAFMPGTDLNYNRDLDLGEGPDQAWGAGMSNSSASPQVLAAATRRSPRLQPHNAHHLQPTVVLPSPRLDGSTPDYSATTSAPGRNPLFSEVEQEPERRKQAQRLIRRIEAQNDGRELATLGRELRESQKAEIRGFN